MHKRIFILCLRGKIRWGSTPYDEAIRCNQSEIAELLRNWHPGKINFYNLANNSSSNSLRATNAADPSFNIPEQDSSDEDSG
jgi:hypothetical protein